MHANVSLAESLSLLPAADRAAILGDLSDEEARGLLYDWPFWARPNQLAPSGTWATWLLLAGRGFGKTRTGAEYIRDEVQAGRMCRVALVAPTAADVRDVMVEGESGILAISPSWCMPRYEPSKRRLTWPNGAIATTYSADRPDRLRGPQHDGAWCDELAAWRYPETWDMLQFGLRLGAHPRSVVTTTPRPTALIKELIADSATAVTKGNTYDNAANLAPSFLRQIRRKYEGTRLGRQEINAEILDDTPGALWTLTQLDGLRARRDKIPALQRIVVAIDPPASSGDESAEAGIIAAGIGMDGHGYVLDDESLQASPNVWAERAVTLYRRLSADRMVGEQNNGGEMVETIVRTVDSGVSYKGVWASRGKQTRAEPIAALYEQGKVHHVGTFAKLEDQMTTWVPGQRSPDRMDAMVWALTELMLESGAPPPRRPTVSQRG